MRPLCTRLREISDSDACAAKGKHRIAVVEEKERDAPESCDGERAAGKGEDRRLRRLVALKVLGERWMGAIEGGARVALVIRILYFRSRRRGRLITLDPDFGQQQRFTLTGTVC